MNFLSPALLWSLLALIPLAAVYFLKVRPRRRTTTAYFLWEKIFNEKKATSLLSKLRDLFSLLLMLLAFAAISFALARPTFESSKRKDLLVIIDRSASMSAIDESGQSRIALAKKEASSLMRALNGNQRAAVASVANSLEFASHFTESPRVLMDAIGEITPSHFPLRSSLLEDFLKGREDWGEEIRVIFLTDGNFSQSAEIAASGCEILKIGESIGNVGIAAADLSRLPDGRLGFYFQLVSSFEEEITADLVLKRKPDAGSDADEGQIFKLIPLQITKGKNTSEVFEVDDAPAGEWIAEIEIDDALEEDNRAFLVVPEKKPVRVRVAAENRYFFETSILAFERGSGLVQLVDGTGDAEVVVGQGSDPGGAPLRILFTPAGESPWWSDVGDEVVAVAPRVKVDDHPALRHIDPESIVFTGARSLTPPENATVLVESETGVPLIYRAADEVSAVLVVNLDPLAADFYFSAWFPTLVFSATTHLAGREETPASTYRPGESVSLPGFREGSTSLVTAPDGSSSDSAQGDYVITDDLGFFTVSSLVGDWVLGSSLLSAPDSDLASGEFSGSLAAIASGRGLSYWLLALAILVLATESILYHRRKVG